MINDQQPRSTPAMPRCHRRTLAARLSPRPTRCPKLGGDNGSMVVRYPCRRALQIESCQRQLIDVCANRHEEAQLHVGSSIGVATTGGGDLEACTLRRRQSRAAGRNTLAFHRGSDGLPSPRRSCARDRVARHLAEQREVGSTSPHQRERAIASAEAGTARAAGLVGGRSSKHQRSGRRQIVQIGNWVLLRGGLRHHAS